MSENTWETMQRIYGPQEAIYNATSTPERKESSSPTRLPSSDDPRFVERLPIPDQDSVSAQTKEPR